jgi:hypothetical protein
MDCTPLPKRVSFSSTEKREKFITTIELLKKSQSFLVRNLIELNDIPEYQQQTITPPRPQSSVDLIDLSSLGSTSTPNLSNPPLITEPKPLISPHGAPPPVNRLSSPALSPPTPPIAIPETEEKIAIYIGSCNLNGLYLLHNSIMMVIIIIIMMIMMIMMIIMKVNSDDL